MSPSVEPFNKAKYKALMDGLECSEISLRYVKDKYVRIDAEYYQKDNLTLENVLESLAGKSISAHSGKTDCSAFYPSITGYYSDDRNNVPFLRVNEIVDGLVVISDKTVFLPEEVLQSNTKTIALAYPGDIIIAKGGNTLAKVGLVTDEYKVYATCRDVIILRTDKMTDINKYYLWAYLHCSFGQKLMWRSASQTGQPHLTLSAIDGIRVPEYSMELQIAIEKLYNRSVYIKQKSQKRYSDAAELLSEHLGISEEINTAISTKMFSATYKATGRLDAEYYQPKYDAYLASLQKFDTTSLPDEFDVFKNTGTNYADGISDVGVIKTKQLTNVGVNIDAVESYFTHEACVANKSTFISDNDVIFASMGVGSLGKISVVSYKGDKKFVTDSTLRIYRAKETTRILPEVLCVFLQSVVGQELIYRYVVGSTGIINVYDEDIAKIPIPVLNMSVQREIAEKLQESFALRRLSKQLLRYAKKAVEMAIEQGEETAIKWLESKVSG